VGEELFSSAADADPFIGRILDRLPYAVGLTIGARSKAAYLSNVWSSRSLSSECPLPSKSRRLPWWNIQGSFSPFSR